jgi:hypothetical protein
MATRRLSSSPRVRERGPTPDPSPSDATTTVTAMQQIRDQYHQSTDGQKLDLTGVPNADDYYLVSTANYARVFVVSDYTNNSAWAQFRLTTDSKGNRKVQVTGRSPCESPGLCGERSTNR